jgi:Uma2 family endonuclease
MSAVTALPEQAPFRWPPGNGPFTAADLDAMPDDGRRYEVIDGMLVVTPGPSASHQRVAFLIAQLLNGAMPAGMWMLMAPFDVRLALDTTVQPDVVVARRADFTERNLPVPPLLAVEVLSPSTRGLDLTLKHDRYRDAGVRAYWVVDPKAPSLRAWELRDGAYAEVAHVTGDEPFEAAVPFPVTVIPSRLLD